MVTDLDALSAALGKRVDGLIGLASFPDARLTFQFSERKLVIEPKQKHSSPDETLDPWFRMRGGIPVVLATLGDIEMDVGIDSGGDFGLRIGRALFDYLIVTGKMKVTGQGVLADAFGKLIGGPEGSLDELSFGGHVYRNLRVKVGEGTVVLGIDILRHHEAVSFDFVNRVYQFGPELPEGAGAPGGFRDWLGLRLHSQERGRRFFAAVMDGTPVAKAGIKVGDETLSVDGFPVTEGPKINEAIQTKGPKGIALVFEIKRDEKILTLKVTPFDFVKRYAADMEAFAWPNLRGNAQSRNPDPYVSWLVSRALKNHEDLKLNTLDQGFALSIAAHGREPGAGCDLARQLLAEGDRAGALDWVKLATESDSGEAWQLLGE
ncbi:MAG: PDZ domain-containing protein, partial [Verrucomicrobiales bacterium]